MLTMEEALKQEQTSSSPRARSSRASSSKSVPRKCSWTSATRAKASFRGNEFQDLKAIKVGAEIDVLVEKLENKEGTVVLSHEKAEFKKNWERILSICNEGGRVMGKVKSVVKGGLVVNVGVEAFLPASQLDVITPKNLQALRRQQLRISKSSRSTRSARTSFCPAAN